MSLRITNIALGRAKGRLKSGQMNKTEAAYAQLLQVRQHAGEIAWYKYEGMTLKLADDTRYTPDFVVMDKDGFIEFHEVKGHWREDAFVKIKVAAAMFPFVFLAVKKDKGGWKTKRY